MGLLDKIIKNTVGDSIAKGIEKAVNDATEKILSPVTEKLSEAAEGKMDVVKEFLEENKEKFKADMEEVSKALEQGAEEINISEENAELFNAFPKWTLSRIYDLVSDETDEYYVLRIKSSFNDEMLEEYHKLLEDNGFTGDFQIKRKTVDNKEYTVDFTFVNEDEISFYVAK